MTRLLIVALVAVIAYALYAGPARAHYDPPKKEPWRTMTLGEKHRWLHELESHALYVKRFGSGEPARWHRLALVRVRRALRQVHAAIREANRPKAPTWQFWRLAQIWLAETIAPFHRDAWPNCPDPFAGGGSWEDTARCEARGTYESIGPRAWAVDPPGYYRCTLQFDPGWERRYARELRRRFGYPKVCP